MKRLAVVSGKGGTGKTMIAGAFTHICERKKIMVDCDVDAANLSLLLSPETIHNEPFTGMSVAAIDQDLCLTCGACATACRFHAVKMEKNRFFIDPLHCEGCAVCHAFCPAAAIRMEPRVCGEVFHSRTEYGMLIHARLYPGAGNSGLLVHELREKADKLGQDCELTLLDGPPGTGCPLISTISGTDAALIVTEPSRSGYHDLERLVEVIRRFHPVMFVVVNRADLDEDMTGSIHEFCRRESINVPGDIPFDAAVIESIRRGEPVTKTSCPASEAIHMIWEKLEPDIW
jgi:MinD superfamily P-loop ATPase